MNAETHERMRRQEHDSDGPDAKRPKLSSHPQMNNSSTPSPDTPTTSEDASSNSGKHACSFLSFVGMPEMPYPSLFQSVLVHLTSLASLPLFVQPANLLTPSLFDSLTLTWQRLAFQTTTASNRTIDASSSALRSYLKEF